MRCTRSWLVFTARPSCQSIESPFHLLYEVFEELCLFCIDRIESGEGRPEFGLRHEFSTVLRLGLRQRLLKFFTQPIEIRDKQLFDAPTPSIRLAVSRHVAQLRPPHFLRAVLQ